ncbi:type II 3-dehydroquinate dehydratase [Cucumibacter marinus]|uniref:type II 3-dehydroquinate dehydratase n=1 Tax=Cucumibacter marinus TaxID=1121252 RepID=UPI000404508A|nr:type II 3-dehydroquinate dehydratase [Cucumibacter marinus]
MADTIHILNGPNLNMLGSREAEIYGTVTLDDVREACTDEGARLGVDIVFEQTNSEGTLVDLIQATRDNASGVIINPGAYSHTSIAIHDALRVVDLPVIEVHISNIFAREPFRHHSYVSPVATGVICGLGATGYILAVNALAAQFSH